MGERNFHSGISCMLRFNNAVYLFKMSHVVSLHLTVVMLQLNVEWFIDQSIKSMAGLGKSTTEGPLNWIAADIPNHLVCMGNQA